jgi:D-alanine-D-alanine ligase
MKKRVGIVFGGRSGEHEISVRSAKTVLLEIDHDKYDVVPLAITEGGKWLSPTESLSLLPEPVKSLPALQDSDANGGRLALLSDDAGHSFAVLPHADSPVRNLKLDVVFPVLHGTFGEDGTIQGLFEMLGVPYVGGGVLASSCGMDKSVMKALFREAGLPICKYLWFLRGDWERSRDAVIREIEQQLGYPSFVKPANLGSSVGVSRAADIESLAAAIDLAVKYDRKIIVEEALEMREIECAVIGNDDPIASLPGEYVIRDEDKRFLDYTEKYEGTGNNEFVVPAPISNELSDIIRQMAVKSFKAIDCSGLARVDFFLRKDDGSLLVNEINTIPGLTDASGFPKMWAATGKPLREVIDDLIGMAFDRFEDRARNRTSFR